MSRISSYLFISLTILLVSLATFSLAANTDRCTVCMYDGTTYNKPDPAKGANELCNKVKQSGCVFKNWYTHDNDPNTGGQKTYCRFQCNDPKSGCIGYKTKVHNGGPADQAHESLFRTDHMDCDKWPIS
ncbi:uncharacterized protein MELLADRAFT_112041 [Melampsora larici-populina 98AG31]|uniref:Secreted protein n=1 Tax=Melampsora larici-populina (strain 98AG31 / pathotype 3-4-7) TaxID=747676 RepID=F4S574_MELLP|nr:uncharacterized protein MELLADRAFT_112041 [Melampsora larici-populina 98AG31]EGG00210.1 secreted protein [Melampsora larici-populina 98AG31]